MTEDGEYDEHYCTVKGIIFALAIGIAMWCLVYLVWRLAH